MTEGPIFTDCCSISLGEKTKYDEYVTIHKHKPVENLAICSLQSDIMQIA